MDGNPDKEVPDGCKDEEFLKKQVVASKDESLAHCKDEDVSFFLGNGIIFFICDDLVATDKEDEHEDTYDPLQKPEKTDKSILGAVEDGRVGGSNLLLAIHCFKL